MSKVIVVDYGHGGTDPGATYKGLREKDLTLQIGRKISAALRSNGVRVIETRTKDQTVSLNRRSQIANTAKADLFVSVHINSAATEKANGVETFSHPNSKNGAKLAKDIQDELVKTGLFKSNRGVKTANFYVLRNTSMPASLVELGFIKNPHDINVMTNKQDELAQAVTNGILAYLGESKISTPSTKAGWKKNNTGWWYRRSDGSYPKSGWGKINDRWYLFDDRGYVLTGWQKVKGTWYYMNKSGRMQTGWIKLNKKWYYLHTNGAMQTGWLWLNENWYYLNSSGEMQVYWFQTSTDGPWFYSNGSGRMQTGWVKSGGRWFYLHSNGHMATGLLSIGGQVYYLQRDGALITEDIVKLEANKSGHLK